MKYKKEPNQVIPFDEVKCRMCGVSNEEPAQIIKECEAFLVEKFEDFGCLEWHTDREWSVDQMMHFLNRTRERNLEDENIKED